MAEKAAQGPHLPENAAERPRSRTIRDHLARLIDPALKAPVGDALPESLMRDIRRLDAKDLSGRLKQRRKDGAREVRQVGRRLSKRKAAIALGVGIAGVSTAAVPPQPSFADSAYSRQVDVRQPASSLSVSDAMKRAMIEEEGVRYTVYRDVAGYPTVGIGHLVTAADRLSVGDTIDEEQALDFLEQDLQIAEAAVARLVGDLPLYQHEFDALVDLVYNVGEGNVSPSESPQLNAAIQARDYIAIAAELQYHHAAGSIANGLVYRSERRANIFLQALYDDPRDMRTLAAR